ncbi:Ger(x)C family spore germination protein [Evansella sp. AB-P1]|uniref:Ger(x)C family spore germination protein n=1 Tax=Evansella sp. AB-P1 TaxID=3037653 RepID=UPI00241D3962|nr:Ger(x)C family spore germination protein [Evansella sp. AB-P1]MDG5785925.1 Ger(x)C family spore germination protein [Evansella sp. AB-P1]
MKIKLVIFIMCISLLTACNIQYEQPTIENYGMVGVMGIDVSDKGKMEITLTLPQPEKDAETKTQVYTTKVNSPHEALMEGSTISEKILSTAQLRVILFSEEFAREKGVWETLENLYRDPRVGTNTYVAVVKGSMKEFLTKDYTDKPDINRYLNKLLEPTTITAFSPFTSIHQFIRQSTNRVSDPMVPYLENVSNESMKISMVALFKGEKMVGTMERDEAKIVEALRKNQKIADISYVIDENNNEERTKVIINFVRSRRKIKSNGDPNNPEIFLHVYLSGAVIDYTGELNLEIQEERQKLEEKLAEQIEGRIVSAINTFQELEIDPIGIGHYFRMKDRSKWDKNHWNDVFSRATVTTHVESRIITTGTLR